MHFLTIQATILASYHIVACNFFVDMLVFAKMKTMSVVTTRKYLMKDVVWENLHPQKYPAIIMVAQGFLENVAYPAKIAKNN